MFRFLHVFQRWIKPVVAEFVATFILLFWACMLQDRFQTTLILYESYSQGTPIHSLYYKGTILNRHSENLQ